jgi:hypothetical protein
MAVSLVDIGRIANDGTGDDLREAFIKVNQNFEELDLRQPEATTASNRGASGEGVFAAKVADDLQFKKIVAGSNVTLSATDNAITVSALGGLQNLLISSDGGSKMLADGDQLSILGGTKTTTSIVGNTLTIDSSAISELVEDPSPQLSADLDGSLKSINNVNVIRANEFQGNVYGIDIREINGFVEGFDFGEITSNITSAIELILFNTSVDFGTVVSPADLPVDLGLM